MKKLLLIMIYDLCHQVHGVRVLGGTTWYVMLPSLLLQYRILKSELAGLSNLTNILSYITKNSYFLWLKPIIIG
jgi:hypothetical protein